MKVLATYIIHDGEYLRRLYDTGKVWYIEDFNYMGSYIGLRIIDAEDAAKFIQMTKEIMA